MLDETLLSAGVAAACYTGSTLADSQHALSGNAGLFSQYIFRGLTQTNRDPALQGGFDYSHESGGSQPYDGQPTGQALSNDELFSYDDWKVGSPTALQRYS